jgi:ABC-2 type transport system ATP-binding protein
LSAAAGATSTAIGAGSGAPAIAVEKLRKAYDGRVVLREVSFEVRPAEIVALLGPNGAGKTTTVEIVEGYRRPDRGTVRVLGADPAAAGRDHRARVGLMLQGGGGIDPRLTAREVVGLHAAFHREARDPDRVLGLVGLTGAPARTRYRRLSGGERQRVGLALAIVGRPDVAILDEPTAGLDVEARAATRELLGQLRADGVAVLLTSHDLADVERIADRIAILNRGRIVALGTAAELTAAARPTLRFRLGAVLSPADLAALAVVLNAPSLAADGGPGGYRVDGPAPTPELVATLAAWCAARGLLLGELRTAGGTLEERYLELTGADHDPEGPR